MLLELNMHQDGNTYYIYAHILLHVHSKTLRQEVDSPPVWHMYYLKKYVSIVSDEWL